MPASHVCVALLCSTACVVSGVTHVLTSTHRHSTTHIRLPDDDNDDDDDDDDLLDTRSPAAPLDAEEAEAWSQVNARTAKLDGDPVDEPQYVQHVARLRIAATSLSLIAIAVLGVQLNTHKPRRRSHTPIGWRTALHDQDCWPILACAAAWCGVLFYCLHGMRLAKQRLHWPAVVQASCLCTTLFIATTSMLTIPDAVASDAALPWYGAQWILSLAAMLIVTNVPSGPRHTKRIADGTTMPMARLSQKGRTVTSRMWFTGAFTLVAKARQQGFLQEHDAPLLGSDFDAQLLYTSFNTHYKRRMAKVSAASGSTRAAWPLLRTLVSANRGLFIGDVVLSFVSGFVWYVPAYVAYRIVHFLEVTDANDPPLSGAMRLRFGLPFCLLMVASVMLQSFLMAQLFSIVITWLQSRIKSQLQTAIFAKALRRKDISGVEETNEEADDKATEDTSADTTVAPSPGKAQVINLVSVDTERVTDLTYLTMLFMSPVEVMVGGVLSVFLLGWGAIVGLLASFAIQPINYFIGKLLVRLQERLQTTRDRKTSILNEVMQAVRMVKFNAWEPKAVDRIMKERTEELRYQRLTYYAETAQEISTLISPAMVVLIAYAWHIFVECKALTPSVAFTSLAVLEEMRFALVYFPDAISHAIQTLVSLRRIQKYLQSDEVEPVKRQSTPVTHADVALKSATVHWPRAQRDSGKATPATAFCLTDVTLRFAPRALTVVVGRLGAGKSLLLQALLGEASVTSGTVTCPRSLPNSIQAGMTDLTSATWMRADQVAYVPQSAFLVNASLRDNVLFGLPLMQDRYQATMDACGLRPDLGLLEDGDETEIGENGIGLSGGQSIRVMLARAVYGRANTLLLDDPLSAVDAHTAAHIHTQLLKGPLCRDRTIVLVTHQVQLVAQSAAQVVMLQDGGVAFQGEPMAFMQSDLYNGLIEELELETQEEVEVVEGDATELSSAEPSTGENTPATTAPPSPERKPVALSDDGATPTKSPRKLVEEEKRAKGAVLMSIYKRYIDAAGGPVMALSVLALLVVAHTFQIVINRWLQYWTDDVLEADKGGGNMYHSNTWWLVIWSVLWVVQILLQSVRMLVMVTASLRASRVLYREMLQAVLNAPMRFHDTVSRGRLMNRFGYDFDEMDSNMLAWLENVGEHGIGTIVTISAVATGGGAAFLLFFVFTIPLYVGVYRNYLSAVRDLKRIGSTTRTPILNTFGDVARGTVVVRAFGASQYFFRTLAQRINTNITFTFWQQELRWWFELQFNALSFFVMLFAMVFVLLNTRIHAAQAGFIFNFLIHINTSILFFLKSVTSLEQKLVSVERIVEYCQLEGEGESGREEAVAGATTAWPQQGQVTVTDLHVRYAAELPDVLKGLSFSIPPRAKVGIVGPTGCGKSTLASSFFRFVEITQGAIVIDGVNIAEVALQDLRARLQIVPQDPIIFSGPLRASLDVFDEYSDAEVLDALRKVQLVRDGAAADEDPPASLRRRDFSDLTFAVAEGGTNLSNGEKQLLCLARAILRRCKLIIFDEATSSVDFDTDALIARTIRDAFSESTIITIAHRLRTIVDYDYVLVMDAGKAVEFASPQQLLRDPSSRFYKLCRATGKRELAHLKRAAGA